MANEREIKNRIKSINDTLKITNAMYLISSSKLKKAKKIRGCRVKTAPFDIIKKSPFIGGIFRVL